MNSENFKDEVKRETEVIVDEFNEDKKTELPENMSIQDSLEAMSALADGVGDVSLKETMQETMVDLKKAMKKMHGYEIKRNMARKINRAKNKLARKARKASRK